MNWNDAIQQLAKTNFSTEDDPFAKYFKEVEKNPAYWKALADLNEEEELVAKANKHRCKRIGIVGDRK